MFQDVRVLDSLGASLGAGVPPSLAPSLGAPRHGRHSKCGVSITCELSVTCYACQLPCGPMTLALGLAQRPQTCLPHPVKACRPHHLLHAMSSQYPVLDQAVSSASRASLPSFNCFQYHHDDRQPEFHVAALLATSTTKAFHLKHIRLPALIFLVTCLLSALFSAFSSPYYLISSMASLLEKTSSLSPGNVALLHDLNLRLTSIGLVMDCEGCGNAITLTLYQSDRKGNAGKPMARVSALFLSLPTTSHSLITAPPVRVLQVVSLPPTPPSPLLARTRP